MPVASGALTPVRSVTGMQRPGEIRHCSWPGFADRVAGRQIVCPKNSLPWGLGRAVACRPGGAGSVARPCTLPASPWICWLSEVEGRLALQFVTAMRLESTVRIGPVDPSGRRPLHLFQTHAQTSRPVRFVSLSGPPGTPLRPGRSGPTCQRRCLLMPPTPRKPGLWWSTETRSKNSTLRR